MKKVLLIAVSALLLISLAACGGEKKEQTPNGSSSVSQYQSKGDYTEVKEKLTWEDINAFPMKRADMTEEEMRQLVVDFYIFSKEFVWVSDDEYTYQLDKGYAPITLHEGVVYAGFPYVSKGTSNVYRMMDYLDPETGVLNITDAGANPRMFGNQCSMSCQWSWARVINSVTQGWTNQITQANGYVPVGPYTYPAELEKFNDEYSIDSIIATNGLDVMAQSYALLKHGDGLVRNGHVIMCTGDAHVEYKADGTIDPSTSYILMSDQTRSTGWLPYTNESGDNYERCGNINKKHTFYQLFEKGYLPFTFKEYTGADPIEETEYAFSHTGETITRDQLMGSRVTSNYYISDIYAAVTDSKGNEVYRFAVRNTAPSALELEFTEDTHTSDGLPAYTSWGSWDNISAGEEYTVQIIAQLGSGERPTVYTGKLIAE